MMTSDDIEGPHKARIALRRLRATLTAFKPLIVKALYKSQQDRLRDLGRIIGQQRDADVLARDLDLPGLVAAAAALRPTTRARLTQTKAGRAVARIARTYAETSWHRPGAKAKTARKAAVPARAVKALDHVWQRSLSHGLDLTLLSERKRHDLRKRLKTLRYIADQFAPLWPGPNDFGTLLAALQDDLGRLNDLTVARAHGLTPPDEPHTLAHAQSLWAQLQSSPQFWAKPTSP